MGQVPLCAHIWLSVLHAILLHTSSHVVLLSKASVHPGAHSEGGGITSHTPPLD